MKRNFKFLIILILLAISKNILSSEQSKSYRSLARILTIKNTMRDPVKLCQNEMCKTIKPEKLLKDPIVLPFCSIKNYLVQYGRNQKFIPKNALKITTSLGNIFLWQNEKGVVQGSEIFSQDDSWQEKIISKSPPKNLNLEINSSGTSSIF